MPQLADKIENLENTPQKFVDSVSGRSWTGHIVVRKCDVPGCPDVPGGRSTVVRHEAVGGANDVNLDDLPANGVVVGRMTNLGPRKEKFYHLPPDKGEWYVILTPDTTEGTATMRLANLSYSSQGEPVLRLMRPTIWRVSRCDDGHGRRDEADAGFKECIKDSTSRAVPNSFDKAGWFTCSLGCCTTDAGFPFGGEQKTGAAIKQ